MMQLLKHDLIQARARLAEATDRRAIATLEGVIMALEWAIEDGGRSPPSTIAALRTTDPLDHDEDGERGGSKTGDDSTAAKGRRRKARKA